MQIGRVLATAALVILPCSLVAQSVPGVDVWMPTPATTLVPEVMVPARVVADAKAYVVVFRVTTDNRIIVLSPRTPYGGYRVPNGGLLSKGLDVSFHTEPTDGVGHLFAAASYTPFNFAQFRSGPNWDVTKLDAPPPGDPQVVADWFLRRIVPTQQTPYSINDIAYYVGVVPPLDDSTSVAQNEPQSGPSSVSQDSSQDNGYSSDTGIYAPDTGAYTPVYTPADTGVSTPDYTAQTYYGSAYPYAYPYAWGVYPYVAWYGRTGARGYAYGKYCANGIVVPVDASCGGRGAGRGRYVAVPGLRVPRTIPPHVSWRSAVPGGEYRRAPRPRATRPARPPAPRAAPHPAPRQSPPPSAQRGQSAPIQH